MQHFEEKQNILPQNIPLWHKNYFELSILRKSRYSRSSENGMEVILFKGKFPCTKEIAIYNFVLLSLLGRERWF